MSGKGKLAPNPNADRASRSQNASTDNQKNTAGARKRSSHRSGPSSKQGRTGASKSPGASGKASASRQPAQTPPQRSQGAAFVHPPSAGVSCSASASKSAVPEADHAVAAALPDLPPELSSILAKAVADGVNKGVEATLERMGLDVCDNPSTPKNKPRGLSKFSGGAARASSPTPGMASERGLRMAVVVGASPAWIDFAPRKVDGVPTSIQPSFENCPVLAAMKQFIRYEEDVSDAEIYKLLKDGPTARRSDHKVEAREAVLVNLTSCLDDVVDDLGTSGVAEMSDTFALYRSLDQHLLRLEINSEIVMDFLDRFFGVAWVRGHEKITRSGPILQDVYACSNMALLTEIFQPLMLSASLLTRVEPLPDSLPSGRWDGHPPVVAKVMWQIDEVFKKGGVSTFKAMEKGWVSNMWECYRAFTFAKGRPAAFLLEMEPSEVEEIHAVQAFCPYLDAAKDEEDATHKADQEDEADDSAMATDRGADASDSDSGDVMGAPEGEDGGFGTGSPGSAAGLADADGSAEGTGGPKTDTNREAHGSSDAQSSRDSDAELKEGN